MTDDGGAVDGRDDASCAPTPVLSACLPACLPRLRKRRGDGRAYWVLYAAGRERRGPLGANESAA